MNITGWVLITVNDNKHCSLMKRSVDKSTWKVEHLHNLYTVFSYISKVKAGFYSKVKVPLIPLNTFEYFLFLLPGASTYLDMYLLPLPHFSPMRKLCDSPHPQPPGICYMSGKVLGLALLHYMISLPYSG